MSEAEGQGAPAAADSMLWHALRYARQGWQVVPLHTVRPDGSCTCKRASCGNPGKHPAIKEGIGKASSSEDQIRAWWETWWPEANIGIVCGAESGIIVVDIQAGHGLLEWSRLCSTHDPGWGTFADTYSVLTGTRSEHFYFRHPGGRLPSTVGKIAPHINTIGDGGYVVAPPSRHSSGRRYHHHVSAAMNMPVVELKPWLLDILLDRPRSSVPPKIVSGPSGKMVAAPKLGPDTRPPAPPPTDADLAPVIQLASREELTVQQQIEAARQSVTPKAKRWRPLASRSPLALYQILTDPGGRSAVFGTDAPIRLNEITQDIWVGDQAMATSGPQKVRIEIEREFEGDDKKGGLKFGLADVEATIRLVAEENAFNPVREYLQRLEWDKIPRIAHVVDEVLGAERNGISVTMLRKWMISAVARAMRPGCKVDTMIVFVGTRQGEKKGTFFEVLGGEWYAATRVNVDDEKESAALMHSAWIIEWAELRSMMKTNDIESVKAFLTTAVDKYRPPYGRVPQPFPRTCVVGGTTNKAEFLIDDTNRRFWPITVGQKIDVAKLRDWRDQLWAEAVAALNAGEIWWLDEDEEKQLPLLQRDYEVEDSWEGPIADWLAEHKFSDGHTTAQILTGALQKPIGQWNRADEMRVARVMHALGWDKDKDSRPRRWKPKTEVRKDTTDDSPQF